MSGDRITEVFAWVVLDPTDDNEGIPAVTLVPGGDVMPLVGADRARIESLREFAEDAARIVGRPVELRRWTGPYEVIDTIGP